METFADVTRLEPTGDGRARVEISGGWTVAGRPNGGYLLALLARAAPRPEHLPHVVAASAHYLRSPEPGPADIRTETLHAGRTAGHVRAALLQHGEPRVEALLTLGRLDAEGSSPTWAGRHPEAVESGFERAVPVRPDPSFFSVPIFDHVEARLDPESAGFLADRPSGRGELRGWLRLPHDEPFTPDSLLFAVDAFPPATFDVEFSGWVPTLQLSAYVRAGPAPGPVRVLQRAQLVQGGRVDEACFVWDRDGRLVAQATQLARVSLAHP